MAGPDLTPTAEIAQQVAELVQIPSVNPLQAGPKSGNGGEVAMSEWLANRTQDLGADVTVDHVLEGRHNVYARFEGETDQIITIDVHLDTVGVEHMTDPPFDGRIEDDRVWGRGSVDTKASLPIVLSVLGELAAEGKRPGPTVNVIGTISEEMGGLLGAKGYRDWLQEHNDRVDQVIVAEPTMCRPVHGHKGACGLEITVHGVAAHSSKPHLGESAISAAARIIAAVDDEQERLGGLTPTTAVGNGSVGVMELSGGVARNIIAPIAELYCGRRIAPGEDPMEIFAQLSDLVRAAASPLEVDIALANNSAAAAFYQEPTSPLIAGLSELAGTDPDVATYGSNALCYGEVASEIVVFGPGSIDQAHKAVEWIDIDQIDRAAAVYRSLLRS